MSSSSSSQLPAIALATEAYNDDNKSQQRQQQSTTAVVAIEVADTNNNNSCNDNENNNNNNNRKRKRSSTTDSLGRIGITNTNTNNNKKAKIMITSGRGSISGWTNCPLCGKYSSKRYALGRGISAHLYAIHTPWKPSKLQRKIIRRQQEEYQRKQNLKKIIMKNPIKQQQQQRQQNYNNDDKRNNEQQFQSAVTSNNNNDNDNGTTTTMNHTNTTGSKRSSSSLEPWEPTQKEINDWDNCVIKIIKQIEEEHINNNDDLTFKNNNSNNNNKPEKDNNMTKPATATTTTTTTNQNKPINNSNSIVGKDRNGKDVKSYRESLPPFIKAAADGNLEQLQMFINDATNNTTSRSSCANNNKNVCHSSESTCNNINQEDGHDHGHDSNERVLKLLNTRDRHLSTAEHWAAGGGHIDCLKYLFELRKKTREKDLTKVKTIFATTISNKDGSNNNNNNNQGSKKSSSIRRRRDGKTCLHYAARNGHIECIKYLLGESVAVDDNNDNNDSDVIDNIEKQHQRQQQKQQNKHNRSIINVDEPSGEGTTPLHMGCFGGHLNVIKLLVLNGANITKCNDWNCNAAHFIAMTICKNKLMVYNLCNYLYQSGVSFTKIQKQGHTPLHKAAQRLNRHLIEWMAGGGEEEQQQQKQTNNDNKIIISNEKTTNENLNKKDEENEDALQIENNYDNNKNYIYIFKDGINCLSEKERMLVGGPDHGGHCPSEIWKKMGGDQEFAIWMKEKHGW